MLLGKVQSGKTRAFLGIIAKSFDNDYDVAVILTKGTRSLAKQTMMRVRDDFSEFLQRDQVQAYDIMSMPELTLYELNQKLILIVKKKDDNLDRLIKAFKTDFPILQQKRVLIVDDEADLASVSFRKGKDGTTVPGMISQQIDKLRELSKDSVFLQVTATPYSLYLQPEEDVIEAGSYYLSHVDPLLRWCFRRMAGMLAVITISKRTLMQSLRLTTFTGKFL